MEISDLLLGMLILLLGLVILLSLLKPEFVRDFLGLNSKVYASTNFPGLIEVVGEPEIVIETRPLSNTNEYKVSLKPRLEYKGEFTFFGEDYGYIDVIPLISYKGREVKGFSQNLPYFRMDASRLYNEPIKATIISDHPPSKRVDNPYLDEMNRNQIFLMEDKGQFLIELSSVESTVIEDLFCHREDINLPDPVPNVDVGLCQPTCWAFFNIKCLTESGIETKYERFKSECDTDTSECSRITECGNGYVDITVFATDCDEDKAVVQLEVRDGKENEEKLGEGIEISFWHKSECIEKNNDYDKLRSECSNDYMGGPYKFTYVPNLCPDEKVWNGEQCITPYRILFLPIFYNSNNYNEFLSDVDSSFTIFREKTPFSNCDQNVQKLVADVDMCESEEQSCEDNDLYSGNCFTELLNCVDSSRFAGLYDKVAVINNNDKNPNIEKCGQANSVPGDISITSSSCISHKTPVHEIGHTLGLFHVNHIQDCEEADGACKGPNKDDCDLPDDEKRKDLMTYCKQDREVYGPNAYAYLRDEVFNDYLEGCA